MAQGSWSPGLEEEKRGDDVALHRLRGAACEQNEWREHRLQGLADLGQVLPWALAAWVAVGNFFNFSDPHFPQLSKGPWPLSQGFLQNGNNKCLEAGWCSIIAFHHLQSQ